MCMPENGPSSGTSLPAEFLRLFSRDQGRLFRYVAALVPRLQDAEDVLSETTVTLWSEFGNFEPGTNFLAWARRIAHLRVLEHYRARSRRLPDDVLAALVVEMDHREPEADPRLLFLAECREKLTPADQNILQRVRRQSPSSRTCSRIRASDEFDFKVTRPNPPGTAGMHRPKNGGVCPEKLSRRAIEEPIENIRSALGSSTMTLHQHDPDFDELSSSSSARTGYRTRTGCG